MLLPQLLLSQSAFSGIKEALPAPGAAVLHWDRAPGDKRDGTTKYRIYMKDQRGWQMDKPLAEISATDWAILGLTPGVEYEFAVRAVIGGREDNNRRALKVTPNNAIPAEEWRGAWISRFSWPGGSRADIQKRLTDMFSAMNAANMNAIVFQVRGQGDTLYPSKDEPMSLLLKGDARETDLVAFAIQQAKRNGIEFHAWLNLSTIWQSGDKQLPADKNHPVYRFADASNPQRALGVIHDAQGKPRQWGSNNYVWLTHGNLEVNTYLRKQVMDFLEKYDVQGLHWDDNTANPNGTSRDPISLQRFAARGNPMKVADFAEWQRDQLSRLLNNIYVQAKAKDPSLLISMSPFGIADRNRIPGYSGFSDCEKFGVEPEKWMNMGVLDAITPQVYWNAVDKEPNNPTLVRDWLLNNKSGRPIWPGSAVGAKAYGGGQELDSMQLRYVAMARAYGAGGNQFWHFASATPAEWVDFGRKAYPTKARVPVPAHMRGNPMGQVMGTVTARNGAPVSDVWVAIDGRSYIYTTCADGFYGIPNLKPGEYTLKFSSKSGELIDRKVRIAGGRTETVNLTLP